MPPVLWNVMVHYRFHNSPPLGSCRISTEMYNSFLQRPSLHCCVLAANIYLKKKMNPACWFKTCSDVCLVRITEMVKMLVLSEKIVSPSVLESNVVLQGEGSEHLSCRYEKMCLF